MARLSFDFDLQKFVAAAHYLASRCPNMTKMKLFKLLYFADKEHLCLYGRPIIGGHYIAMKDGPVPSQAYDAVKSEGSIFHQSLLVHGYSIAPRVKELSLDVLSDSDVEVLNKIIATLGSLTAAQLRTKSQDDAAWSKCQRNSEIDFVAMLRGAEGDLRKVIFDDQTIRDLVDDVSLTEEPARP